MVSIAAVKIAAVLTFGFLFIGAACLAYAVRADARVRGQNGFEWGVMTFLLSPLAVPLYLVTRARRFPPRELPPTRRERIAGAIGGGTLGAILVAVYVSPPDPFSQVLVFPPLVVVFVPLVYLLVYELGLGRILERLRVR